MEEKKKGFAKKFGITAAVLVVALGVGLGAYFAVSNNSKETAGITTNPPHEQQDPTTPVDPTPIEPDEPVKEPDTPIEEPDEPPVEEPEPEEPIEEPDTSIEEPDEPPIEEPPVEEQAREDMIFFDDTGELNTEGFHKALMYIMENYEYKGMTLNKIFYERAYDNFDFFAVNWSEEDNNIYMYGVGDLKTYSNNNNKQLNITRLTNIDLKGANFENSLEKFVEECMDSEITGRNVYTLDFCYTEDDLDSLEDYYTKAYQMAEHRIEQELGRNEIVIGSFIKNQESAGANFGIGNTVAFSTYFWVLNERTNEITEMPIVIYSSSVLGKGYVDNLMNSPLDGSDYVVVYTSTSDDVATIEPETLYNVEDSKTINTKSANTKSLVKTDKYAFVVDDKYYEL